MKETKNDEAWVLHHNNDLQFNEVPKPIPQSGEVLVQVKAAGICASDIRRVYDNGAYHYPIILGHEFSGVTKDGRRVGVFPLLPCHQCDSCRQGHYGIELVKPNGELILVGNPNDDFTIGQNLYWQILRKQITVSGV